MSYRVTGCESAQEIRRTKLSKGPQMMGRRARSFLSLQAKVVWEELASAGRHSPRKEAVSSVENVKIGEVRENRI